MKTPPNPENVTTLATAHRSSARTGPRARRVIFKRGERWPVGFAGLVSHPDLGTQFIQAGRGNKRKRPGVPTDSSIGQADVPGMPPGELLFHVFGLAWHIHGISFVPMFEGKFSKLRGPNKAPTGRV